MNNSTFEEVINKNGRLVYTNVGISMMPLIRQGRDLMIIGKPPVPCRKYDVVLYKRDDGTYVLHRILKAGKDGYVICGDHCWKREYGIVDRNIIGILTAVVRDGRTIPVTDFRYRVYVHLWCDFFPVRAFILKVRAFPRWLKKKLAK